jgi:hypothetical protein
MFPSGRAIVDSFNGSYNHNVLTRSLLTDREASELSGKPVEFLFPVLLGLNQMIEELRFETFISGPGISDRVKALLTIHPDLRQAFCDGQLAPTPGMTIWDKFASAAMARPEIGPVPEDLISVVGKHSPKPAESALIVSSTQIANQGISELTKQVRENDIFAICSRVNVSSGEEFHIPMLDFLCPCSKSNQLSILNILREIGEDSGALVESGRSYHYYGFRLLARGDWVRFLARALMFAPFSDPRYIAHRLLDGQCRLRVYSQSRPMPTIGQVF